MSLLLAYIFVEGKAMQAHKKQIDEFLILYNKNGGGVLVIEMLDAILGFKERQP